MENKIITATTFQLRHSNPKHPSFTFDIGEEVICPLGKGIIVCLDKETGNCKIKLL